MKQTLPRAFLMPDRCACCLAPSETYLESSATKSTWLVVVTLNRTVRIRIPYCRECRDHVESTAGWRIFLFSVVVFFGSWFVTDALLSVASWLESYPSFGNVRFLLVAVGLALPFAAVIAFVVWSLVRQTRSAGPEHVRRGAAVALTDFTDTHVTLEIHNPRFLGLTTLAQSATPRDLSAVVAALPSATRAVASARTPVARPTSVEPVHKVAASEAVRQRLANIPRNAKPENVLRFVTPQCRIEGDGLVATGPGGTSRKFAWSGFTSVYMRHLPHDAPWERALVVDLVPATGAPVRLLPTTAVNYTDLPGGGASSYLENARRLGSLVLEHHPEVSMDPATRGFVTGFGPCPSLSGIEQFFRYDDQFGEPVEGSLAGTS